MNATTQLQQLRRLRPAYSNARVPDIVNVPQKYQQLFLNLGSCPFIASFKSKSTPKGLQLQVSLRPGEQFNLVVLQRLKQLFKGIPKVSYPTNFEQQPFTITIAEI